MSNSSVETFNKELKDLSDEDLCNIVDSKMAKLCQTGGRSFTMTIPPRIDDLDIAVFELLSRFQELKKSHSQGL